MKLIILSDSHLAHVTPEFDRVCQHFCCQADLVVHLGDWTRGPILDYLEQFPLVGVFGNMDDHIIQQRLPFKRTVKLHGYQLGLMHGWGLRSDIHAGLRHEFPHADIIIYGHTHQPEKRQKDGVLFFNPGSLTSGRGDIRGSLGIIELDQEIKAQIINVQEM